VLGIFETEIVINDNRFKLRFYIVPDNTMVMNAILGRDFITKPGVSLYFQNVVVRLNLINAVNQTKMTDGLYQILCVDYELEFESVKEKLNVNPEMEFTYVSELIELYKSEYVLGKRCIQDNTDPNLKMKLVLKHDQPISYRARRISYSNREKLSYNK